MKHLACLLVALLPAACWAAQVVEGDMYHHRQGGLSAAAHPQQPLVRRQGRLLGGASAAWLPWRGGAGGGGGVTAYAADDVFGSSGHQQQQHLYGVEDDEEGTDVALEEGPRSNGERALSLFGVPLFNPLQLLTNPFAIDTTLINGLALKKPFNFDFKNVVGRATIAAVAGQTVQGEVVFFQEDWKKPVVVLIALTGLTGLNNIVIDIHPNIDVTANCANVGLAVFNPTGALNGGVLVSAGAPDAQGNLATILRNIPINRLTLLGATSIINRSVLVAAAGVNQGCGAILKQTTPILGR